MTKKDMYGYALTGASNEASDNDVHAVMAFVGDGRRDLVRAVIAVHRFGGNHAQRDMIDLTLIEAAIRSGNAPLASALAAVRANRRHESLLSQLFVKRVNALATSPRGVRSS